MTSEDLVAEVAVAHGYDCDYLEFLGRAGTRTSTLRDHCGGQTLVVRLQPGPRPRLDAEHALLAAVRKAGVRAPDPLAARDGQTWSWSPSGDAWLSVHRLVRGRPIERPTAPSWRLLASTIARLHDALASVTLPVASPIDVETLPVDDGLRSRVSTLLDAVADAVPVDVPHQLLHGDLALGNVLLSAAGVGFIDFEEWGTGPRVYDWAAPLCVAGIEHHPAAVDAYLAEAATSLLPAECDSLVLMCATRRLWLLAWESRRLSPPPPSSLLRRRVEAIEGLVEAHRCGCPVASVLRLLGG